jgi:hypothetical protein
MIEGIRDFAITHRGRKDIAMAYKELSQKKDQVVLFK